MEKDINEVGKIIKNFYKELGGNPDDIVKIGSNEDSYEVLKEDGKKVTVTKKLIENYMDSKDSISRSKIKTKLIGLESINSIKSMNLDDIWIPGINDYVARRKESFYESYDYKGYEFYVSKVIQEFEVFKNVKIERNIRLNGITQPGKYEIDILIKIPYQLMEFKIIIECKNWAKPVGREVVQKVLNTKNAVNANKAAIVSPVGYTKEAVQVAKHYNIALWVLNLTMFYVVEALNVAMEPSEKEKKEKERKLYEMLCNLRAKYFDINKTATKSELKLVEFKEKYSDMTFEPFNLDLQCCEHSQFCGGSDGIDLRLVTTRIAAEIEMMNQS
jgi:hypothetical protein